MLKQKQFSNSSHMLVEAGTAFILKVVEFYGEWKKGQDPDICGKIYFNVSQTGMEPEGKKNLMLFWI